MKKQQTTETERDECGLLGAYLITKNKKGTLYGLRHIRVDWRPEEQSLTDYQNCVFNQLIAMSKAKHGMYIKLVQKESSSKWKLY